MRMTREYWEFLFLFALSFLLLLVCVAILAVMVIATLLVLNLGLSRKTAWGEFGMTGKRIWPAIRVQLPFTVVALAALIAYATLNARPAGGNPDLAAYLLLSVPLQEFLFRGYGQSVFRKSLPPLMNALLIAALFSLLHVFTNAPYTPILMAATFIAGLAWGFAYEKERNLLGPIVSHAILGSVIFLILS